MTHDLVDGNEFSITHSFLATMLGVRRPSVTTAARALKQAGLIDYWRGRLAVRNRSELEAASCECYQIMRGERRRLLGY